MVKRDLIRQLVLVLCLVLGLVALRLYLFEPVTIQKEMANQYLKEKDLVLVAKQEKLRYGDLVLYQVEGKDYVGRIIGMAEDRVTYMDDVLYRNEGIVTEHYLGTADHQEYFTADLTVATLTDGQQDQIPEGQYLILHDKRGNQADSRSLGLISRKQIVGPLTFRLSPLDQFGFIQTGLAQ